MTDILPNCPFLIWKSGNRKSWKQGYLCGFVLCLKVRSEILEMELGCLQKNHLYETGYSFDLGAEYMRILVRVKFSLCAGWVFRQGGLMEKPSLHGVVQGRHTRAGIPESYCTYYHTDFMILHLCKANQPKSALY